MRNGDRVLNENAILNRLVDVTREVAAALGREVGMLFAHLRPHRNKVRRAAHRFHHR